jgi:hypothetical protein
MMMMMTLAEVEKNLSAHETEGVATHPLDSAPQTS